MDKIERTVYVSGISPEITYQEVRGLFRAFGEVEYAFVSNNTYGPKHAFIRYATVRAAQAVLKLKGGLSIRDSPIRVRPRRPQPGKEAAGLPPCDARSGARAGHRQECRSAGTRRGPRPRNRSRTPQDANEVYAESAETAEATATATEAAKETLVLPPSYTTHVNDSLAYRFESTPLTMGYGTNGELMFGPDAMFPRAPTMFPTRPSENDSRVIRVSGIPLEWEAWGLFKHLSNAGLPVKAVLVYADFDERKTHDGLVQLSSAGLAASLVVKQVLKTPLLTLGVVASSVRSIGPVRQSYCGQFSAFGGDDDVPSLQEEHTMYGYSVAEPSEPDPSPQILAANCPPTADAFCPPSIAVPSAVPGALRAHAKPVASGIESGSESGPESGLESGPECDREEDTGQPEMGPPSELAYTNRSPYGCYEFGPNQMPSPYTPSILDLNPTSPVAFVETPPSATSNVSNDAKLDQGGCTPPTPFYTARASPFPTSPFPASPFPALQDCAPLMVYHKPSQTVIVDNFGPSELQDARALSTSMAQFGKVYDFDLVPLGVQRARAYITFANPIVAEVALGRLRQCSSSVGERLHARLA